MTVNVFEKWISVMVEVKRFGKTAECVWVCKLLFGKVGWM